MKTESKTKYMLLMYKITSFEDEKIREIFNIFLNLSYHSSLLSIGTNYKPKKNSSGQWTMNFLI